jgi:hypothetical protein
LVLVEERDEIALLHAGIDHLPVLVVDHRRDARGLVLQQRVDVEALLEHLDVGVGLEVELGHPVEERVLVAAEPDAQRLALEVGRLADAAGLLAGEHQPRAVEDLRDVDQRHARSRAASCVGHPVDDRIGLVAGQHLHRRDIGAAGLDRDVEAFGLVVALRRGDVVAGELRLRHPLHLHGELLLRLCADAQRRAQAPQRRLEGYGLQNRSS